MSVLHVDEESKNSVVVAEIKYHFPRILMTQTLRERVFGPLYGRTIRLVLKQEVPEEGKHWTMMRAVSKVIRKEEIEAAPTRFVGFCRGLFRS